MIHTSCYYEVEQPLRRSGLRNIHRTEAGTRDLTAQVESAVCQSITYLRTCLNPNVGTKLGSGAYLT